MRIAYLNQSYPPMISGAALTVERLAREMSRRGHQVLVLAASDRGRPYDVHQADLSVIRLKSYINPIRTAQRYLIWPQGPIRKRLAHFEPDIIHLQGPLILGLCGLRVASTLDIPTVVTLHQLPWFVSSYVSSSRRVQVVVENALWGYGRWFASHCAATIAPSRKVVRIFQERTGLEAATIGWGVNTDRFTPVSTSAHEAVDICSKYALDPSLPVILHVGRLDLDKQVHLVLQAAARVFRSVEAQLLVVGDGAKRKELLQLCTQLGIRERVVFTGFVDHADELPGIYRLADAFVTASEIETQGLVVLEALASGLPVVAPKAGALPELVTDGANGFLVPPKSTDAMARRLQWLLSHPVEAQVMGATGVETAKRHAVKTCLDAHETLYQQYANSREKERVLWPSRLRKLQRLSRTPWRKTL